MNLSQLRSEAQVVTLTPEAERQGFIVRQGWGAVTDGYILFAAKLTAPPPDGTYSLVDEKRRDTARPDWHMLIPRPDKRATLDADAVKATRHLLDWLDSPGDRVDLHEGGCFYEARIPGLYARASFGPGKMTGAKLATFGAKMLNSVLAMPWFDQGVTIEADATTQPVVFRAPSRDRLALLMPLAGR